MTSQRFAQLPTAVGYYMLISHTFYCYSPFFIYSIYILLWLNSNCCDCIVISSYFDLGFQLHKLGRLTLKPAEVN